MPFDVLLGVRKPDQGLIQVVETVGLLLGIESTGDHGANATAVYRTVPPGSIYGPTLRAITRKPTSEVLEWLRLLDLKSVSDGVAHEVFAKTLQAGFAAAGNARGSPGLAPPWAASTTSAFTGSGRPAAAHHNSFFANSLGGGSSVEGEAGITGPPNASSTTTPKKKLAAGAAPGADASWDSGSGTGDGGGRAGRSEVDAAVHALKLAVVGVTRRLMDDVNRLPLQNRTTAVLIDGSRMSLLALELAGAAWKFGKFVVVHVSGEKPPGEVDDGDNRAGSSSSSSRHGGGGPECEDESTADGREGGRNGPARDEEYRRSSRSHGGSEGGGAAEGRGGRWEPGFLEAELREMCIRQLEIPEESLELVFRSLPANSPGTVDEVTKIIDGALAERGVEVVFMGCYGRRGPRVTYFGSVAHWALEHTPYQIVFAKKFSPSMVSLSFCTRPKRYLVAVTSDLDKVSHTLDRLLPLVSPGDSLVLSHIIDESGEDIIAGEGVDADQVKSDLQSLLSNKRELSYRVRVEKTGRPPEQPTQTVVQKIVKVAEEEAADFLAILYDESRGSYRTVATGCLRETRCGLIAIH